MYSQAMIPQRNKDAEKYMSLSRKICMQITCVFHVYFMWVVSVMHYWHIFYVFMQQKTQEKAFICQNASFKKHFRFF